MKWVKLVREKLAKEIDGPQTSADQSNKRIFGSWERKDTRITREIESKNWNEDSNKINPCIRFPTAQEVTCYQLTSAGGDCDALLLLQPD